MDLNQPTITLFEQERRKYDYYPPDQSDSFYTIGEGHIDLFNDKGTFTLTALDGTIQVGGETFRIDGKPYKNIIIEEGCTAVISGYVFIDNESSIECYGTLVFNSNAHVIMDGNSELFLGPNSTIILNANTYIQIGDGSYVDVFGSVFCDISLVQAIMSIPGLYLDSICNFKIMGVPLDGREYSLTDYDTFLRTKEINKYTRSEKNTEHGRVGYLWKDGSTEDKSQCLELMTLFGDVILGDYKLSILGTQNEMIKNNQINQSFRVYEGSTLYISNYFNGFQYLMPELYLGVVLDNTKEPGYAVIDGTVTVQGEGSMITVDRGAKLIINETGKVYLKDSGIIKSTNNPDEPVVLINGELIIEHIEQIATLKASNLFFGEKGKITILNPTDHYQPLFGTPNQKYQSLLYTILGDYMDHLEYHVPKDCAIVIDQYYEYYNRDMTDWFAGRRIEQAIYDGILVMEEGSYIQLDNNIIPWATLDATLYDVSKLFKSVSSNEKERLQDVVSRLIYAGCNNIIFRIISGEMIKDIPLVLDGIKMNSIVNTPMSTEYILNTDVSGSLFIKNAVDDVTPESIVYSEDSREIKLNAGDTHFNLE